MELHLEKVMPCSMVHTLKRMGDAMVSVVDLLSLFCVEACFLHSVPLVDMFLAQLELFLVSWGIFSGVLSMCH